MDFCSYYRSSSSHFLIFVTLLTALGCFLSWNHVQSLITKFSFSFLGKALQHSHVKMILIDGVVKLAALLSYLVLSTTCTSPENIYDISSFNTNLWQIMLHAHTK
jgi:hypothetical protein